MNERNLSIDKDLINEIIDLNSIKVSWKEYCLLLLNSTPNPLRDIWRKKLVSSIIHTEFCKNSTFEGNLAGMEIMTVLPNDFTENICDDHFEEGYWKKLGRLPGSKRMSLIIGHYPQESVSNEANMCINYIIDHWNEMNHIIFETPLLKNIWDFSQMSMGECLYPDEVLTYSLEKDLDDAKYGAWLDANIDIFKNGLPSDKFKKYYFSDKINGFPFKELPDLDSQIENFKNVCDKMLKEDVNTIPCWKKICICILKNDVSFRYAGFGMTLNERKAREDAIKAFSKNREKINDIIKL